MYGRDVWEREFLAFDHFAAQASRPLQYVFGDHTLLNIIAVDKEDREHTFRLWWTVNFCAYIRGAVGMTLLHEPPSIKSATAALHHTIWPKQNYGDLELERLLPCFGIPEIYSLDNAWAHHSYTLEELAQKIGQDGEYTVISIEFRRPYRARQGALIERFFGDIKKRLAEALRKAGAIAAKHPKHIRAAREEACLLYQDIYRILLEIMVDHFHTQHSELGGLSPYEKWMSAIEESGYKEVPPHTPAMERLFWRYVPRACAITEKGVGAFNMHYTSDQLRRLGKSRKQASGNVYQYSYDPDNISRIALFRNGDYLFDVFAKELRLPDGSLRVVSEAEMKLARDIARTRGAPLRSWYRFLDSKLADIIRQRQQERKEVEKAAQAAQADTEGTQQDEQGQNGADATPPSDTDLADEIKRNLMGFTK
jgi:transposase InsO family protein